RGSVHTIAWRPNGKELATGGLTGSVAIWETSRAEERVILPGHTDDYWQDEVWQGKWNPIGTGLASCSGKGRIILWDPQNAMELWSAKGETAAVRSLAWSPDGRHLASGGETGNLKIWDAATGEMIFSTAIGGSLMVAWSPDGEQLAVGAWDGIQVWDVNQ